MMSVHQGKNAFVEEDFLSEEAADVVAAPVQDVFQQILDYAARATTSSEDSAQLSSSALLAQALHSRRIQVMKLSEQVWVFQFAGSVIGGFSRGVTTLVSEYARQVLASDELTRAHLQLRDIDTAPLSTAQDPQAPEPESAPGPAQPDPQLAVEVYCVGNRALSTLADIDLARLDSRYRSQFTAYRADSADPQRLRVGITELIGDELGALAVKAMRTIPGLQAAAVRMAVDSLQDASSSLITGIYPRASLVEHHAPDLGPGQDVAGAIAEKLLDDAAA